MNGAIPAHIAASNLMPHLPSVPVEDVVLLVEKLVNVDTIVVVDVLELVAVTVLVLVLVLLLLLLLLLDDVDVDVDVGRAPVQFVHNEGHSMSRASLSRAWSQSDS